MKTRLGWTAGAIALAIGWLGIGSGCATTAVSAARGQWYEVRTPRFQLWTDGDPQQARTLVEDLERFHQIALITTTAEERDVAPPVRIFLAKDDSSFQALSGLGGSVRGVFKATPRGLYAIVQPTLANSGGRHLVTGRHILFHEYAHYIQALAGARTPSWYNEGFAEYMATTEFEDDRYTVGCAPLFRTEAMQYQDWVPMGDIFAAGSIETLMRDTKSNRKGTDSYAQSWFAFHYFASDAERQSQLRNYLHLWAEGTPSAEAVERAFGMNVTQLDTLIKQHSLEPSLDCLAIKPKVPLKPVEVGVRPLGNGEAHYHVGDLVLNAFGPTDAAFTLLNEALQQTPPGKPALPVLVSLALANLARADSSKSAADDAYATQAQRYLAQAQKLDPAQAEVLFVAGEAARLQAERVKQADPAQAKTKVLEARIAYRNAIHADETLAIAYDGLGRTYLIDDNGSQEAQVVLEAAAYLLPLSTSVPMTLARIHVNRGNMLQALPVIEYVLMWSKNDHERAEATELLNRLRGDAAPEQAKAPANAEAPANAVAPATPEAPASSSP